MAKRRRPRKVCVRTHKKVVCGTLVKSAKGGKRRRRRRRRSRK